jgi:hypothetical protein
MSGGRFHSITGELARSPKNKSARIAAGRSSLNVLLSILLRRPWYRISGLRHSYVGDAVHDLAFFRTEA